jgi:hypothetical protein
LAQNPGTFLRNLAAFYPYKITYTVFMRAKKKSTGVQRIHVSHPESTTFLSDWQALTPRERLRRSWRLRKQLANPKKVHDSKLFPKT